ncbi:MAG: OmpA family protein [Rhodospirillales bacterium]
MRQEFKLMAAALALVAVAGCSNRYVDDAKSAQPRGDAFESALARHYLDLAKSERKQGDVDASTTFARRSTASAEGQLVLPDDFTNRKIASRHHGDLGSARQRLLVALDGNGRTTAPDGAARAQVLFDCWVEQAEENLQPDDIRACREGFEQQVASVESAIAGGTAPVVPTEAGTYLVFFNLNSANLTPEAEDIIGQAVSTAKGRSDAPITVTGFTDTTGTPQYNLRLSKRRAEAVADAMVAGGVDAGRITTDGVGENNLLIPTGDGVAEPQNRRAQVAIGR